MWNNGDQCAVRISEGYADYQGGTDLLRHPEVKKPDIAADGHRSRPASNRSAASAVSESSKGPESNGTARRKNSTVKTRFSASGKASNASRSSAVWLLMFLGYPFPRPSARQRVLLRSRCCPPLLVRHDDRAVIHVAIARRLQAFQQLAVDLRQRRS